MNITSFLEIQQEYTEHLIDILTPFIYADLCTFYKQAINISDTTSNILLIFQKLLLTIDSWTQHHIEEETNKIKQMSGTTESLDNLVCRIIKSNITLLTYSSNIDNSITQTFYDSFSTSNLIHRCYIECAKDAHNNPFIFYHDIQPTDLDTNQFIIKQNIKDGIIRGIRKSLPIRLLTDSLIL